MLNIVYHENMVKIKVARRFIVLLSIFYLLEGKEKKLLLIGIDGCRSDALQIASTPNIDNIIEEGLFISNALCSINGQKTKSGPGWASLLTGVWADKHGIVDNSFKRSNIKEYPPFNVLIREAKDSLKTAAFIMWEPILEHIFGNTLDYSETFSKYDESMAVKASKYISTTKLDAIFIDFDHVDRSGHWFGFKPKIGRYTKAIEQVDTYIGWIYEAITKRGTYANEDWLVIITSDHGGRNRNHGGQSLEEKEVPIIIKRSNKKQVNISSQAYLTDIVPTILDHFDVSVKHKVGLKGISLIDP